MKKILIALIMLAGIVLGLQAQTTKSDNITKATEALHNGDLELSLSYVKTELTANPKNGEAHFIAANILEKIGETDRAIKAYGTAIKYSQDKELTHNAYYSIAIIYNNMENDSAFAVNIEKAAAYSSSGEDADMCLIMAAQAYLFLNDVANCERLLIKMKHNTEAMALMAQMCYEQERYDECIKYATLSINLDYDPPSFATHFFYRHLAYIEKKEYAKAAADIVAAVDLDDSYETNLVNFANIHYNELIDYLKTMIAKDKDNPRWMFVAGYVSNQTKHYNEATLFYTQSYNKEQQWLTANMISNNLFVQGNIDQASLWAERALQHDNENENNLFQYALCQYYQGNIDKALALAKKTIDNNKNNNAYLHLYATLNTLKGDYSKAIATYNYIIDSMLFYPAPYYVLCRAKLYDKIKKSQEAKTNYNLVVENETDTTENTCRQQALLALGNKDKAIALQQELLKDYADNEQTLYNAACFYSLLGEYGKAMECLHKAIEKNITYYIEMQYDVDLATFRNQPEYKTLQNEYKTKAEQLNTNTPLPKLLLYDNN